MNTTVFRKAAFGATLVFAALASGCLKKIDSGIDVPGIEIAGNTLQTQNVALAISGYPQNAILMGESYSFTPTATDPDSNVLVFSIQNLPTWASFDTVTGEITGQPSLADVGVFNDVIITVSNGVASTSLPLFSITVSQVALGSVTLSWKPPTENMDGSVLTDLAGYRLYYGPTDGSLPRRIDINTAGLARYVVENLLPNDYEFVITAVNSSGFESPFSNVAVKFLP